MRNGENDTRLGWDPKKLQVENTELHIPEDRKQDQNKWNIILFSEEMTIGSRRHVTGLWSLK